MSGSSTVASTSGDPVASVSPSPGAGSGSGSASPATGATSTGSATPAAATAVSSTLSAGSSIAAGSTSGGTPQVLSLQSAGTVVPVAAAGGEGSNGFVAVRAFEPVRVPAGSSFTITLPDNTFTHSVESTPVQVSASTADGSALPDWMTFSPADRSFTGTPPPGVSALQVVVAATDANGNRVTTTLNLQFTEPAR